MKKAIFGILACFALMSFISVNTAHAVTGTRDACNGGQCVGNGTRPLDCPSSGGPTCADGETCLCHCVKDGSTYTPTNECGKLKARVTLELMDVLEDAAE